MIFVKIITESIRKNPRAGATQTTVHTGKDIEFRINGVRELPDIMNSPSVAIVTSRAISTSPDRYDEYIEGCLFDESKVDEVRKIEGATVTVHYHHQTFNHRPEPDYFYEHENPQVECSHCRSLVPINDIVEDYEYDGYDEYLFEECPICNSRNTFPEREYETINSALRNIIEL